MIKEQIKCPRCNKILARGYSMAIKTIMCSCGHEVIIKKPKKDGVTDDRR